jgi:cyclohexanone monooxygenase
MTMTDDNLENDLRRVLESDALGCIADLMIGPEPNLSALRQKYDVERDRRLRPDGARQYVAIERDFSHYAEDPYNAPVDRDPLSRVLDVAVIGAGFAGLLTAIELKRRGVGDIAVIEKGGDFGGTWYWNRYPGVMCDTESYIYMPLLEDAEHVPSQRYASGHEIYGHARNLARKFALYDSAIFQTKVERLEWSPEAARWRIHTDRGDDIRARFVVVANGLLERPKLPGIPGIDRFRGHTFHTSRWDYGYTGGDQFGGLHRLADKRVGIVGTGATGVQCIPKLAESARELYVFQRTPAAVGRRDNRPTDPEWARSLAPGWQERLCRTFNDAFVRPPAPGVDDGFARIGFLLDLTATWAADLLGRAPTEAEAELLVEMIDAKVMDDLRQRVGDQVRDPAVAEALKPWHRRWCKRPIFHDEYLEAFNRPNVRLVDTRGQGIERFTETAAIVDGRAYELDCLIFASGFEVGTPLAHRAGFEIYGRDGESLSDHWRAGMRTMHGVITDKFPNCFFNIFGQNAASVNFSHLLHQNGVHIAFIISEMARRGVVACEPSREAIDAYVAEGTMRLAAAQRFWAACTPGYFNDEGKPGGPDGFFANTHAYGSNGFLAIIEAWRAAGNLSGLELTFASGDHSKA